MVERSVEETAGYEIVLEYLMIYSLYLQKLHLFRTGISSELMLQVIDAFMEASVDRIPTVSLKVKDSLN